MKCGQFSKCFKTFQKLTALFVFLMLLLPIYPPLIAILPATLFLCPLVLLRKLDSPARLFNYYKNQYVYDILI